MANVEKQAEYVKKYKAKLYRVPVYIPKEEKNALQAHAKTKGYDSLNAYTKALYEADSGLSMSTKKDAEA